MAEPLKHFFSRELVRRIGRSLAEVHPKFPLRSFVRDASRGLDELELKARAEQIAAAMRTHLPPRYPDAIRVIVRSLGPENDSDESGGAGMAPFFYLPHTLFVARHGLDHFELSMPAQHELTRRFTCEFSIRAFIEKHPERTFSLLERWARDANPHVRRLVSEGTRPRLPWGARVRFLDDHPERCLSLLELLKDDPSPMVRRSVANHLNDLSKTYPELAFATARRWLEGAPEPRRALVAHALRSAVKRAEREALALLGFGARPRVGVSAASFEPARVSIGDSTRVSFELRSRAAKRQTLAVDLIVHFVKARGVTSAKVFKLAAVELPPKTSVTLAKRISLAVHTTRKPNPGKHRVEALINGERFDLGAFQVTR